VCVTSKKLNGFLKYVLLIRISVVTGEKRAEERHSHRWQPAVREISSLIIIGDSKITPEV
jgi:hypothetical protein